jgi:RNA polymerase sigma-70 factor (ECF subfamily)
MLAGAGNRAKEPAGVAHDELSLIAALRRHEGPAWSDVVEQHLGEVYGFVFHLLGGDRAAAEELNQEVWLEAIDGIKRCDPARGSFRNWLLGIARRRAALYYRRRASPGGRVPPADLIGDMAKFEGTALLPEDALEQVERASAVRAAMLLLPSDRREVLCWKYVEGLSVETIAARLGRTAKAVESLLSRAREQMRILLCGYVAGGNEEGRVAEEPSNERSIRHGR